MIDAASGPLSALLQVGFSSLILSRDANIKQANAKEMKGEEQDFLICCWSVSFFHSRSRCYVTRTHESGTSDWDGRWLKIVEWMTFSAVCSLRPWIDMVCYLCYGSVLSWSPLIYCTLLLLISAVDCLLVAAVLFKPPALPPNPSTTFSASSCSNRRSPCPSSSCCCPTIPTPASALRGPPPPQPPIPLWTPSGRSAPACASAPSGTS